MRVRSTLVKMMPRTGGTYCEPFAGRGNVLFQAVKTLDYANWHLNDTQTAPFFRALVSHGATFEVPERSPEVYWQVRSTHPCPESYLLESYLCFAGATYQHGGYKGDGKGGVSRQTFQSHIREAHRLLIENAVVISGLDYRKVLVTLNADDFAYFDPPYFGTDTRAYRSDMIDHEELVAILKRARFRWMLSEYRQSIYLEAFGKPRWTRNVQLLSVNKPKLLKKRRVECVWTNY